MRQFIRAFGLAVACAAAHAIVPQHVQDLSIQRMGVNSYALTWSPVSMDVDGQPVISVSYNIHRSNQSDYTPGAQTLIATSTEPAFLDASSQPRTVGFYRVTVRAYAPPSLSMVAVPAGSFAMGYTNVASPIHTVNLVHSFAISRSEVTNQQFLEAAQWAVDNGHAQVTGGDLMAYGQSLLQLGNSSCEIAFANGAFSLRESVNAHTAYPNGYNPANHPVKMVTWYGAACYCDWVTMMYREQPYYEGQWNSVPSQRDPYATTAYRLPTEAEWEFAAQYDDERAYPWGNQSPNCTRAVFGSCMNWSMAVGSKIPGNNALGLQDMAGNAYEWCNDWSATYTLNSQENPVGPFFGSFRLIRGGGWDSVSAGLNSALRVNSTPVGTYWSLGFRVCRTVN